MKRLTCYSPYNVSNNLYVNNVKELITNDNIDVISIKDCLKNFRIFKQCSVYNFNWFEKVEGKNIFHDYLIYFSKVAFIKILKLNRKKIIYTIHNKKPHNIKNDKLSIKMMKVLCKEADIILGMCIETRSVIESIDKKYVNKLQMVLHPNYIKNYDLSNNQNYRNKYGIKESELVFMFFGAISPYKNIEMLIDIFNELKDYNIKLLIVGNPSDLDYKNKIIKRINKNTNIICELRFIEDEEVVKYYNTSDIIILPYKKDSSLNSGAVYLSFSLKKTVIVPRIGSITDLNDGSFVYSYDYKNEDEHYNEIKKQIIRVYKDFKYDSKYIKNCGIKAFEYVQENHSDDKIKMSYSNIYENLI